MTDSKYILTSERTMWPKPQLSLGQYMLNCLRANGDSVALIDAATGATINYREILEQSIQLAHSLKQRGLKIGDHVAISSENRLNLIIPTLASLYLGAVVAPMNPTYSKAEIQHALKISKPTIIFVSERTEEIMREAVDELNIGPLFVQLSSEAVSKDVPTLSEVIGETRPIIDFNTFNAVDFPNCKEQIGAILCSSGTTGLPKGVMLSHHSLAIIAQNSKIPDQIRLGPNSPLLGLMPFFHGYGFALSLGLIASQGKSVVLTKFNPELFLESIQKYKVTTVPIAPPIMVFLAKHPIVSKYDLSSLEDIICGAAPLTDELQMAVTERIGVPAIRQGYGMTETSVIGSLSPRSWNKVGSVGIISPDLSCKVVDLKTSETLGPHQLGEFWFKGDLVMMGYCGDPKATAEIIDKDGWLHSGDIGYYDEDGYIFVVDRLKELIKYKGFQVPPAELEAILLNHPAVKDAAVIGLPDENSGELPIAFVVLQPEATASAEEIRKFVDAQVTSSKWLRGGVRFLEEIPKNPSGKILRRELRALVKSKL